MKFLPMISACALVLGGCATLSEADRAALQQHRVPAALQARMIERDSLELADIIELSRRGMPADFIVRYLRSTGKMYTLTSLDVVKLRDAGVRPGVIDFMLSTPAMYPRYVDSWYGYDPYYYYNRPVIVVRDRHHRH